MLVQLPHPAVQVAAGGHHTVVLLNNGQVYTFGNHQVIKTELQPHKTMNILRRIYHCFVQGIEGSSSLFTETCLGTSRAR